MVIAGTGHRPDKLGGYSDEVFVNLIEFATRQLKEYKPELIYSGMALGWDQALCYACRKLEIPYIAVMPYRSYGENWPEKSQHRLELLLRKAREVRYVSPSTEYHPWLLQDRNEYMVNESDLILALWNGSSGGTNNCIGYAHKVGKPVENVWHKWELYKKDF